MERIRWDRERKRFVFGDEPSSTQYGTFALESALDLSLASVRKALARQAGVSVPPLGSLPPPKSYGSYEEFVDAASREPDTEICFQTSEPWEGRFFHLTGRGHLRAHFVVDDPIVTDRDTVIEVTARVFGKAHVVVEELHYTSAEQDDYPYLSFQMICDPTGQTVGSFWQKYGALCFALRTFSGDFAKSAEGVQLALRLGRPDVLIGTPESSWLDVKSRDYFLSSAPEKIKLAQDVARFANANGGVLVLGLRTSQSNGVDTISHVTPLPLPARSVTRYRNVIDAHVYPFVRGLEVFSVPYENGELVIISIPPQLEDDKPFLVHGSLGNITDNKVKGQFVSVVQRRGDGAEYLSGPAIHGLLASRKRLGE
jgi:hypothetical protein